MPCVSFFLRLRGCVPVSGLCSSGRRSCFGAVFLGAAFRFRAFCFGCSSFFCRCAVRFPALRGCSPAVLRFVPLRCAVRSPAVLRFVPLRCCGSFPCVPRLFPCVARLFPCGAAARSPAVLWFIPLRCCGSFPCGAAAHSPAVLRVRNARKAASVCGIFTIFAIRSGEIH